MPFVRHSTWEEMRSENADLTERVEHFESMLGIIALANELRTELIATLESMPGLTPEQIGELAYRTVLENHMNQARDEIVAQYEQQNRAALYARVIKEVEETDGPAIFQKVRERVESDPELAVQLRESAQKELAARANDVIRSEITAEQQAIIDIEAERQLALDRLDVEFAIDGELDLNRDDIKDLLRPGDRLVLIWAGQGNKKKRITFEWIEDVYEEKGWVFSESDEELFDKNGEPSPLSLADRFVYLNTEQKDLVKGEKKYQANVLKVNEPLCFVQVIGGKDRIVKVCTGERQSYYPYEFQQNPLRLIGTDFQTKALNFSN